MSSSKKAKLVLDKMLTICLQNCKWRMQHCGLIDQRIIGLCGTPAKPEKIDFRYIEFNVARAYLGNVFFARVVVKSFAA